MSQTAETTKSPKPSKPLGKEASGTRPKESWRDTLESLAVAGILALLIHCFVVEAFVIPTGSMATTLMGRHKEVVCPECGRTFSLNAYEELGRSGRPIVAGICDNCRYPASVGDEPSFKGDRILVMKFPYDLPKLPGSGGPNRWDVIVFKYPNDPERQNYIKRLVGLPEEDLRVLQGDIQTRPKDAADKPFTIRRKPLFHQRAMQFLVYDDAQRPRKLLIDAGRGLYRPEWQRWSGDLGWTERTPGVFAIQAKADWSELRYRHLVPDLRQWQALIESKPLPSLPKPSLITDFNSYNTSQTQFGADRVPEPHWVGDLTLEARLNVRSTTGGEVRLRLIKGGVSYDCVFHLPDGEATLQRDGKPFGPKAATGLGRPGDHEVVFANVDGRLTLWIDGETPFGDGVVHDDGTSPRRAPTAEDLSPARIAARGPVDLAVAGLVLKRDIYYTQDPQGSDYGTLVPSYIAELDMRDAAFHDLLSDPKRFGDLLPREPKVYSISKDRFMMMGDNSPRSSDGRAWDPRDRTWDTVERQKWEVTRGALIGKAFFVYWPHGKPFWPRIRVNPELTLPFRPYLERMKLIR